MHNEYRTFHWNEEYYWHKLCVCIPPCLYDYMSAYGFMFLHVLQSLIAFKDAAVLSVSVWPFNFLCLSLSHLVLSPVLVPFPKAFEVTDEREIVRRES